MTFRGVEVGKRDPKEIADFVVKDEQRKMLQPVDMA
jgi:hypothetical protein